MSNRLAAETSPYLLQHAENPVDWYAWGPAAFAVAREQDKPVFLSVGYSACHWCHVMEHESFEDQATAELMNRHFVSVKVDREERPDVDAIYMEAVQALSGSGGWPMSVFLTPAGEPFFGGTYFPDTPRFGMPSFTELLSQVADLWETRRDEVLAAGASLTDELRRQANGLGAAGDVQPGVEVLSAAQKDLSASFDREYCGWGLAPKFPQPAVLEFLIRRYLVTGNERPLEMVQRTLDAMMRGGIYDQIGGGFHRYATDQRWLVPHFEKMLYDNAQLARVYLHSWQITGNAEYRRVVTETLDYVVREMLDPDGGFYSAQDADTEGEEGRFFVWEPDEIRAVLSAADDGATATEEVAEDSEADLFLRAYGISPNGNFEGRSILYRAQTPAEIAMDRWVSADEIDARLSRSRGALFAARENRVKPGVDDKVLSGWNGLMLAAFAEAARVLDRDDYRRVAERNAEFLLSEMRDESGRMLRTWKRGQAKLNGYLEDYATVADGLLELYQTTFDTRWFITARALGDAILTHFADPDGGFFDTSNDHEELLVRPKNVQDGASPSGGAMAAGVLLRLGQYTGEAAYASAADRALANVSVGMERAPLGFAYWLGVLAVAMAPPRELAIVGAGPEALLEVARGRYRPELVVAVGDAEQAVTVPLLQHRMSAQAESATAYVCRRSACEQPVTTPDRLAMLLD